MKQLTITVALLLLALCLPAMARADVFYTGSGAIGVSGNTIYLTSGLGLSQSGGTLITTGSSAATFTAVSPLNYSGGTLTYTGSGGASYSGSNNITVLGNLITGSSQASGTLVGVSSTGTWPGPIVLGTGLTMTGNTMNSIDSLGTSYSFGSGFSVSGGTNVSLALTGSDGIVTNGGTIGLSSGPLGTAAFMSSGAFSSSGALFSVSTSGAIGNGGFTGNGTSTNSLAFDPWYVAAAVPVPFRGAKLGIWCRRFDWHNHSYCHILAGQRISWTWMLYC